MHNTLSAVCSRDGQHFYTWTLALAGEHMVDTELRGHAIDDDQLRRGVVENRIELVAALRM